MLRRLLSGFPNVWVCVTITLSVSFTVSIVGLHEVRTSYAHTDGTTNMRVNSSQGIRSGSTDRSTFNATARIGVSRAYGQLPLYFEANRGQTDSRVKFLARSAHRRLFLTATESVFVFAKTDGAGVVEKQPMPRSKPQLRKTVTQNVLRMALVDANPQSRVTGLDELPGRVNYFIGNDPTKWRTNVPTFAKVRYEDLYQGIDLVYHGNQGYLEYDFIVRPGADPHAIRLGFHGADNLEVDAQGDLLMRTPVGTVRHEKPRIYQDVDGVRREISGGYALKGTYEIGFEVAAFDASRPLVIDPVLFYSTYLGGSGSEIGMDLAVDSAGNAYVSGETFSSDFPTQNAIQSSLRGSGDAFVVKLNPTGSGLMYSTYLGGSGEDYARAIAVDSSGAVYITGFTQSGDFPTVSPLQASYGGGFSDNFVAKISPSGSSLVYSTYLGGSDLEQGTAIGVDSVGAAYVAGETNSTNYPSTTALTPCHGGGASQRDAFVSKLNPSGSALVYSTCLGGSNSDQALGIALDNTGNVFVAGSTGSSDFPTTPNGFQTVLGGTGDCFVSAINAAGGALVYSTYFGGSGNEGCVGLARDTSGNVYITGLTDSNDLPTTVSAFQSTFGGGGFDAFVGKLNPSAFGISSLIYSTYLGGNGLDIGLGVAVDSTGNAYVTGETSSTNFPKTAGVFQGTFGGGSFDAFVGKVNPLGNGLVYSSYLGGSGDEDQGFWGNIAVDLFNNAYVTGVTSSSNFPTTPGAFQTALRGSTDAFVTKISDIVLPPGATSGKVTGGGTVNVSGGAANFGFIVQAQLATGQIAGDLQYVNHASRAKVHSIMFTTFVISGNAARFDGTCTNNGVPCTFTVMVIDNGEPGTTDSFTISVSGGPMEGGTLRSGNIQIH